MSKAPCVNFGIPAYSLGQQIIIHVLAALLMSSLKHKLKSSSVSSVCLFAFIEQYLDFWAARPLPHAWINRRHISARSTFSSGPPPNVFSTGTTAANQFNTAGAAAVAGVWFTVTLCFPSVLFSPLEDDVTLLVFSGEAPVCSLQEEGPCHAKESLSRWHSFLGQDLEEPDLYPAVVSL